MTVTLSPLGDIAEFYAGSSLQQGEDWENQDGGYLLTRVSDMNRTGNEKYILSTQQWSSNPGQKSATCPGDAIIIPKRGGAIGTNKKRILQRAAVLDPNLMAVKPIEGILDLNYLYQWFLAINLGQLASGSSVPQLNKKDLSPLPVPLPPLAEQKRIAGVLDQVDTLRVKRRMAVTLLDDLIQSIFLDMFGPLERGNHDWPIEPFGKHVEEFRYGTSNKSATEGNIALRIPNVVGGMLDLGELKRVPVTDNELDRLRLRDGDILFVRSNGNPTYVGRCAVFSPNEFGSGDRDDIVYASYLIRARLHQESLNPTYARTFMASITGRSALYGKAKTSAGQYNLNIQGLASIDIPIPPQADQGRFAAKVTQIEAVKELHSNHLAALDELFISLQQRAFSGTLWDHDGEADAA